MAPDTTRARLEAWVGEAVGEATPVQVAAAVATAAAERGRLPVDGGASPLLHVEAPVAAPDEVACDPWAIGSAFELAVGFADGDGSARRSGGVHYTPRAVAARLAEIAIGDRRAPTVCDPSVGGGAFLLAAAEVLAAQGIDRAAVVERHLWGIDVEPDAVMVAEAALALWASAPGGVWHRSSAGCLRIADTLQAGADALDGRRFDVVVGNPPFQNQLRSTTARGPADVDRLRRRWGVDAGAYADAAAWFLVAACELASATGTVALIVPESTLATTDAQPVREHLTEVGAVRGLWVGGRHVFADADVRVCAPVVDIGAPVPDMVARWAGPDVSPERPQAWDPEHQAWSELVADLAGVPAVDIDVDGPLLSTVATATAGFRDEFYGLAEHATERLGDEGSPLVTVGMIDPLRLRWGNDTFRFAGRRWTEPVVHLDAIADADARLAAWVQDRLVPKVLVATQTKVVETVVDTEGVLVPVTPVVAVTASPDRLWHVAAVLSSPVATALALRRHGGTAMSADTIKLSARQVLALPLPTNASAWDRGAAAAQRAANASDEATWRAAMESLGQAMVAAYGVADSAALSAWWSGRLPGWR